MYNIFQYGSLKNKYSLLKYIHNTTIKQNIMTPEYNKISAQISNCLINQTLGPYFFSVFLKNLLLGGLTFQIKSVSTAEEMAENYISFSNHRLVQFLKGS